MALEWFLSAVFIAVLSPTFGHFEAVRPTLTRIARWLVYLGITGLFGLLIGRPWTFVWVVGWPLVGIIFHITWCLRHGINPITAEPRDKYEQLRARRTSHRPKPKTVP